MNPATLTLRHTVATLAYRAAKAVRDVTAEQAVFRAHGYPRTPAQILAHMGDLFDWALSMTEGKQTWKDSQPLPWEQEVARFFAALGKFDARLADESAPELDSALIKRLFQGPVADALTHTGQIALLRRLAGTPVKAENYAAATIEEGILDPSSQAFPIREF